jgi:hypothetical protein
MGVSVRASRYQLPAQAACPPLCLIKAKTAGVTGVGYACVNSPVARILAMMPPSFPRTSRSATRFLKTYIRASRHPRPSTVLNSRRHAGPRSPHGRAMRACATWPSPTASPTRRSGRSSSASPRPRELRSPRRPHRTAATMRSPGGPAPALAGVPDPHCGVSSTPGARPSWASARAFRSGIAVLGRERTNRSVPGRPMHVTRWALPPHSCMARSPADEVLGQHSSRMCRAWSSPTSSPATGRPCARSCRALSTVGTKG